MQRCLQITKKKFWKSESGSFAVGIPRDIVALKIFILNADVNQKGHGGKSRNSHPQTKVFGMDLVSILVSTHMRHYKRRAKRLSIN